MGFHNLLNNGNYTYGARMDTQSLLATYFQHDFVIDYISVFIMSTIVGAIGAFQAEATEDKSFKKILIERITSHGFIGLIVFCFIEGMFPDVNIHMKYAMVLAVSLLGLDKAFEIVHRLIDLLKAAKK